MSRRGRHSARPGPLSGFRPGADGLLGLDGAVAAGSFGLVHGQVGALDQAVGLFAGGKLGHAQADGDGLHLRYIPRPGGRHRWGTDNGRQRRVVLRQGDQGLPGRPDRTVSGRSADLSLRVRVSLSGIGPIDL